MEIGRGRIEMEMEMETGERCWTMVPLSGLSLGNELGKDDGDALLWCK